MLYCFTKKPSNTSKTIAHCIIVFMKKKTLSLSKRGTLQDIQHNDWIFEAWYFYRLAINLIFPSSFRLHNRKPQWKVKCFCYPISRSSSWTWCFRASAIISLTFSKHEVTFFNLFKLRTAIDIFCWFGIFSSLLFYQHM